MKRMPKQALKASLLAGSACSKHFILFEVRLYCQLFFVLIVSMKWSEKCDSRIVIIINDRWEISQSLGWEVDS